MLVARVFVATITQTEASMSTMIRSVSETIVQVARPRVAVAGLRPFFTRIQQPSRPTLQIFRHQLLVHLLPQLPPKLSMDTTSNTLAALIMSPMWPIRSWSVPGILQRTQSNAQGIAQRPPTHTLILAWYSVSENDALSSPGCFLTLSFRQATTVGADTLESVLRSFVTRSVHFLVQATPVKRVVQIIKQRSITYPPILWASEIRTRLTHHLPWRRTRTLTHWLSWGETRILIRFRSSAQSFDVVYHGRKLGWWGGYAARAIQLYYDNLGKKLCISYT